MIMSPPDKDGSLMSIHGKQAHTIRGDIVR